MKTEVALSNYDEFWVRSVSSCHVNNHASILSLTTSWPVSPKHYGRSGLVERTASECCQIQDSSLFSTTQGK